MIVEHDIEFDSQDVALTLAVDESRALTDNTPRSPSLARGLRNALDGKPSNVRVCAHEGPDNPEAAQAIEVSGPLAPTAKTSGQPGN